MHGYGCVDLSDGPVLTLGADFSLVSSSRAGLSTRVEWPQHTLSFSEEALERALRYRA